MDPADFFVLNLIASVVAVKYLTCMILTRKTLKPARSKCAAYIGGTHIAP